MTRRELLEEQYEDALFALLMDEVAVAEGQKLMEENERLKSDPDAVVPMSTQKKCIRAINRYFRKKSTGSIRRTAWKFVNKVALVALLGMILVTAAFAVSPTFRVGTLNLLVETLGDRTNLQFYAEEASTLPSLEANWIPEGFEFREEHRGSKVAWLQYINAQQDVIDITIMDGAGRVASFDTENAMVSDIEVQGRSAMLIEKGEAKQIVWADAERSLFAQIRGYNISKEAIIKIAEHVVIE